MNALLRSVMLWKCWCCSRPCSAPDEHLTILSRALLIGFALPLRNHRTAWSKLCHLWFWLRVCTKNILMALFLALSILLETVEPVFCQHYWKPWSPYSHLRYHRRRRGGRTSHKYEVKMCVWHCGLNDEMHLILMALVPGVLVPCSTNCDNVTIKGVGFATAISKRIKLSNGEQPWTWARKPDSNAAYFTWTFVKHAWKAV